MDLLSWTLIGVLVSQQAFWMFYTQRLLNKLMSRDYHSYRQSQVEVKDKVFHVEQEAPEDLRPLQEFSL